MFGHRPRLAHPHQGDHPHPLRRQLAISLAVAALLAVLALLLLPPRAHGNFVYWTNSDPGTTIGRAKINGTALNDSFISGLNDPEGVAVDSKFIYWAERGMNRIGRANLDGTGVDPGFISTGTVSPVGIAVNSSGIYWGGGGATGMIGHANLDGGNPDNSFINFGPGHSLCGIAADQSFVYWQDTNPAVSAIGRAPAGGGTATTNFVPLSATGCGIAVDPSFIYWGAANKSVGRVPIGGGAPDESFIPNATPSNLFTHPDGVAVNPQYVFWSDDSHPVGSNLIGRANLNGAGPNPSLIPGVSHPFLMAAAPSNKITINSVTRKPKKGIAIIDAKVPGPGQVTLSQTPGTQDVNATAAAIKQIGLTITQASSFTLAVKPTGKTAKKLNKQIKKQLRKKRKAKAKAKVTGFITFVPSGVAGVSNTDSIPVTLVKQRTKKK